jgi:hypothetical protein
MGQSGKLAQLKTAAKNLLTTLQAAAKQPGDVKVSIIPFDTTVNVGTVYKDEFWIDYTVKGIQKSQWTGCVMGPRPVERRVRHHAGFGQREHVVSCQAVRNAACLDDAAHRHTRHDGLHQSQRQDRRHAGVGQHQCHHWNGLGWHSLTKNLPLSQAADPSPARDKVVVLLTDGTNTQNRWSSSDSQIDPRTALACANAKNANIKIYTVRVIDGDRTLLKNCASKPTMYYEVNQASELNAVFSSIAQNLARLRISK